jgi:hypothetical protein
LSAISLKAAGLPFIYMSATDIDRSRAG